jgi:hypothetical protein
MPAEENGLTNKGSTEEEDCKDCTTREGPLDTLARSLASGEVSRGRALRLLGGALVGGLLGAVGVGRIDGSNGEAQAQTCAGEGERCRSTPCCEGLLCVNGECTSGCPAGQTRCVCPSDEPGANIGTCVNRSTDPNNCGTCCNQCAEPTGTDAPCRVRACVSGACTTVANPAADGAPCDDGNLCTVGDTCNNGTCQPGTPVDCSALDTQCTEGFCNQQTGTCAVRNRPDNTSCETGNLCTADRCQSGTCTQGPVNVTCPTSTDPCKVNVCNPATGGCVSENAANGTACVPTDKCATSGTCQGGQCQAQGAKTCPTSTDPCKVNVCNPVTGDCESQNAADGTTCSDGNPCTTGETCQDGTCQGGTTVANCCRNAQDCPTPTNQCQRATCDTATGTCGVENKPNSTSCDLLACRSNETCLDGVCQGGDSTCGTTGQNTMCCGPGTTRQGQCRRATNAECSNDNQCCNSCGPVAGLTGNRCRP